MVLTIVVILVSAAVFFLLAKLTSKVVTVLCVFAALLWWGYGARSLAPDFAWQPVIGAVLGLIASWIVGRFRPRE